MSAKVFFLIPVKDLPRRFHPHARFNEHGDLALISVREEASREFFKNKKPLSTGQIKKVLKKKEWGGEGTLWEKMTDAIRGLGGRNE